MKSPTLFGHLAFNFAKHPENLAVEALGFILKSSATARNTVATLLRRFDVSTTGDLLYDTQVIFEDLSRPDIVGTDDQGRRVVMIEAKFWAGLTENQPNKYTSDSAIILNIL